MEVSYMSVDLRGVIVQCTSPLDTTKRELDVIGLETNLAVSYTHLTLPTSDLV